MSGPLSRERLGEVTGVSNKKEFMGKEYDYVFDVAMDDTAPALQLPYNKAGGSFRTSTRPTLNRSTVSTRLYEHSP